MNASIKSMDKWHLVFANRSDNQQSLIDAEHFANVISRERKRAERTEKCLLLLIMDIAKLSAGMELEQFVSVMTGLHSDCIREIDACGWLAQDQQLGIVFSEIPAELVFSVRLTVEHKMSDYLRDHLPASIGKKVETDILVYPDDSDSSGDGHGFNPVFYPELFLRKPEKLLADGVKRFMDIVGSIAAILLFSPFFLVIPILIKLTSPGPVFFMQERLGKFGKTFRILKFRSMSINNDDAIHRQYIGNFIANKVAAEADDKSGEVVFKIRNDPRVTPLGQFLRKSSLDEIPQFFNVLKGEMSLVGPRPPIPYEVSAYYLWHCYRSFAVKPGITGLWQVSGRSKTTFDEMVRLDLQYIRSWSVWLDIRLLLATPRAVLRGKGAY